MASSIEAPTTIKSGVYAYRLNQDRLVNKMQLDVFNKIGKKISFLGIYSPSLLSEYQVRLIALMVGKKLAFEFVISQNNPRVDEYLDRLNVINAELDFWHGKGVSTILNS